MIRVGWAANLSGEAASPVF